MTIADNHDRELQIARHNAFVAANTNALLFVLGWILLVAQYGAWQGQYVVTPIPDENANAVFLIFFSLLALGIAVILRRPKRIYLPYKWLLIVFFINLLLASILRDDILSSLRQYAGVILSFGVVLFMAGLLQALSIKRAIFTLTLLIFVTLLVSTYVHVATSGMLILFNHTITSRLGGLFYTAHFAMLAGLSGLLSLIVMLASNFKDHKIFHSLNLVVMSVLLVFTDTRSVMVVYVACGLLVYLVSFRRPLSMKRVLILLFVLGAGLFLYYYFYIVPPDLYRSESNLDLRSSIWRVSIDGILANPFVGYGKQNFLTGSVAAFSINPNLADSHNALFDHALRYGIISLLIFLLFCGLLGVRLIAKTDIACKGFVLLLAYWFGVSLFWGYVFNISGGMIQIVFLVTLFGILCHPDIYRKRPMVLGVDHKISGG